MRSRNLLVAALALVTGAIASPEIVQATTISAGWTTVYRPNNDVSSRTWMIRVVAAEGETNRITAQNTTVQDLGGEIVTGDGCSELGPNTVACPPTSPSDVDVVVDAKDGADQISIDSDWWAVDAGTGDDVVTIGRGSGMAFGGEGRDQMNSAGGRLRGGSGDDDLSGAGGVSGPDLVGGKGNDRMSWGTVSYSDRRLPVRVVLKENRGYGGSGRERDVYGYGVTDAEGGEGDDVLIGDDADNRMIGNGGVDRLVGGDGNDTLLGDVPRGGPPIVRPLQADIVLGGPGDDRMTTGNGGRADGGRGDDEFTVDPGATAIGGAGKDMILVRLPRLPEDAGATRVDIRDGASSDVLRCDALGGLEDVTLGPLLLQRDPGDAIEGRPERCGPLTVRERRRSTR